MMIEEDKCLGQNSLQSYSGIETWTVNWNSSTTHYNSILVEMLHINHPTKGMVYKVTCTRKTKKEQAEQNQKADNTGES